MSSAFVYNERTDFYEAMDGAHSIYIADDVFMIQLQLLKESGLSETEALDEVLSIGWWMEHLPLAGVFIDGIEQTDEGVERYEERHPSK